MIYDRPNDRVFLKLGDPSRVLDVLADWAEPCNWKKHNVVVELNRDTAKVLRNMGMRPPSLMEHEYNWPGKFTPMAHQIDTAEFITLYRRGFVLNEQGTMKTASALWAVDYMMKRKMIRKVLILAPLSTLEDVWQNEVFKTCMHRSAAVLHGSRDRRLKLLASDFDMFILNYEGLDSIAKAVKRRKDIDLIIVDECANYRNGTTDRYDTLQYVIRPETRLIMMSGTPCPNAPTDAYSQAKLVNPHKVPPFFTTFKKRVMMQVSQYKWVPRVGSHEMAFEVLQPAVRYEKAECLDLPPLTTERRHSALSKAQTKAFSTMKNQMVAATAAGEQITAINAADKIGKLRQILCGAMRHPETGEYISLPHVPRLKVLIESIESASAKVLVIVPFKGITRVLSEELTTYGITNDVVNGDVSMTQRGEIFRRFRTKRNPHTLLCHPQVMAHGLTLTEADVLVFYAPVRSNDQVGQVTERINRQGQTRKMTVIQMHAHPMEVEMYEQIEAGRLTQKSMLDLYNRFVQA